MAVDVGGCVKKERTCPGCGQRMPGHLMMDGECWRELPAELRAEWRLAKKSGNLELKRAAAYRCMRAAIDNRHEHEAKHGINRTR